MTDEAIIDGILKREGGFVNHPADRGGPTKFGITQATLASYWGHPATMSDVQALDEATARQIYRSRFITGPGFHTIHDDALRSLVVDMSVNHGPGKATRMLQEVLGVEVDGTFGPQTAAALVAADPFKIRVKLTADRVRFYGHLISLDPSQAIFAAGWCNRAAEFVEALSG